MKNFIQLIRIIFLIGILQLSLNESTAQYCTPSITTGCQWSDIIDGFSINTLKNLDSHCNGNPNGYINYSPAEFTTNLEQGASYEVMVLLKYSSDYVRMFFDFNKDGDFNDVGEFFNLGNVDRDTPLYSTVTIPAGVTGNVRMRVRSGFSETVAPLEACMSKNGGETEDYTVTIVPPYTMAHLHSTTYQDSSYIEPGASTQNIIKVEIETTGSLTPLDVTLLNFTTASTTDPANITNARLYYTGGNHSFSSTTEFGSMVASPNGNFSFSGNQTLLQGRNYFWLTYDVETNAPLYNILDASCSLIKISGTDYIPSDPDPIGSREIMSFILMQNGSATVSTIDFCDDGGFNANYTNTAYTLTLYPSEMGKVVKADFREFYLCSVEQGCDVLKIYDGNSTSATLIGDYRDESPGIIISTAADGSLTFEFNLTSTFFAQTLDHFVGWRARISNILNGTPPTASISGDTIISPGGTADILFNFTGDAPYTLIYANGSNQDTITNITTASYILSTSVPGTYTIVKISDNLGRVGSFNGTATITFATLPLEPMEKLAAPEGISPNGDNFNDFFVVKGAVDVSLEVYNREGGLVYSSDYYKNNWDGRNKSGELLPDGTYYYVITTKDKSDIIKNYLEIRR